MHFTPSEELHILTRAGLQDLHSLELIKATYNGTGRHYHDWNHALSVLSWVNHCCDISTIAVGYKYEIRIAALFHDAVYTTQGSPQNEKDSVNFLIALLSRPMTSPNFNWNKVERFILATALHGKLESEDVDFETALFLDCDIASFGEPCWEIVVWNDQNILKELLQKHTLEQIKVGRKAFLEGLLAKQSIFLTPYFQDRFEAQARRNIRRLIKLLAELRPQIPS